MKNQPEHEIQLPHGNSLEPPIHFLTEHTKHQENTPQSQESEKRSEEWRETKRRNSKEDKYGDVPAEGKLILADRSRTEEREQREEKDENAGHGGDHWSEEADARLQPTAPEEEEPDSGGGFAVLLLHCEERKRRTGRDSGGAGCGTSPTNNISNASATTTTFSYNTFPAEIKT